MFRVHVEGSPAYTTRHRREQHTHKMNSTFRIYIKLVFPGGTSECTMLVNDMTTIAQVKNVLKNEHNVGFDVNIGVAGKTYEDINAMYMCKITSRTKIFAYAKTAYKLC